MIRWSQVIFAFLLLLQSACGGGGSSSSAAPAILSLKAEETVNFDVVRLAWTSNSTEIRLFELEIKTGSGPFESLGTVSAPALSVDVHFPASFPELQNILFRLRGRASVSEPMTAWIETSFFRSVHPPSPHFARFDPEKTVMTLDWIQTSKVADRFLLQRRRLDSAGRIEQDWQDFHVIQRSDEHFEDSDLVEKKSYEYRWACIAGSVQGPWTISSAESVFLAPLTLHAVAMSDGVHLSWTNRSTSTEHFLLWRLPGLLDQKTFNDSSAFFTSIPGEASAFVDITAGSGLFTYILSPYFPSPGNTAISKLIASATPFQPPGGAVTMTGSIELLPKGRFLKGSQSNWYILHYPVHPERALFLIQTEQGWIERVLAEDSNNFFSPNVEVDASGRPHLVYAWRVSPSSIDWTIKHDWFDGSIWHSEDVRSGPLVFFGSRGISMSLDHQGSPLILIQVPDSGDSNDNFHPEFGEKGANGWSFTTPSYYQDGNTPTAIGLTTALDGTPIISFDTIFGIALAFRQPSGLWIKEPIPGGYLGYSDLDGIYPMTIFAKDKDNISIITRESAFPLDILKAVFKRNAVWGPSQTLLPGASTFGPFKAAYHPPNGRLAVAAWVNDGMVLFTKYEGEPWQSTTLATSPGATGVRFFYPSFMAFDASGNLDLLWPGGAEKSGNPYFLTPYLHFLESR